MPVWNPWHGCHKYSEGCRNCYVFREDAARGTTVPTTEVRKTSMFRLPLRRDRHKRLKFPPGTLFWLCYTSDLLIEEADGWRHEIWDIIRERKDCHFVFFTKRIERLSDCLPPDWGDGWDNVTVGLSVENRSRANYRLPIFLSVPLKHRYIVVAPMLEKIDLKRWLEPSLIEEVTAGGESGRYARPLRFDWILDLRSQCVESGIPFTFHQTGTYLIVDGKQYHIPREHQHDQARRADVNFIPH
ncbi:MAG: phage Gp37/Gp68 family protein [Duncaniella sp.]|nr:phage Gp37/Gp68 family protein [Duncaniella sp.]